MFLEAVDVVRAGADRHVEAARIVAAMTLSEKLGCLDGDTEFWSGLDDMMHGGYHEHPWPAARVERLGVPGVRFVDGPRGSVVGAATCFPVSMARGATFDPALEERIGVAIGAEMAAIGADFTGAVCLNLLRHPGWGRAQETYGEDPHHVGEMAAAFTRGLQRHVMACMKHFALNSMENARFTVDVTVDERALHEVYLPHFRRVADEGVASTMTAYNSVNGQWCGDSPTLITDILRDEWGWDGFVITDFVFGLRDPVGSVTAGLDIEMPFRQQRNEVLADAIADGRLTEADVDRCVERIVATLLRFAVSRQPAPPRSILASDEHRTLAREASIASTVMLHNDRILPLGIERCHDIAVLGRLAARANLGDGGSSDVRPPDAVTLLEGIIHAFTGADVRHADDDVSITVDADVTIVVVGFTKDDEGEYLDGTGTAELMSLFPTTPPPPRNDQAPDVHVSSDGSGAEPDNDGVARPDPDNDGFAAGGDRRTLRLHADDDALITAALSQSAGPVVVVVMGGSAAMMPWLDDTAATLQVWYPGLEGGHALADILTGVAEPGGRLPFALPHDEADLVHFDPDATSETYGLFHGQWHLDRQGIQAQRPFGFGLGYTTFTIDEAIVDSDGSSVSVTVTNTGERAGSTVVYVFAGLDDSRYQRPQHRLVGFARIHADADSACTVGIAVDWRQLDIREAGGWVVEPGDYRLDIGFDANQPATSRIVTRRT